MALLDRLMASMSPAAALRRAKQADRTGRRQAGLPAADPCGARRHCGGGIPRRALLSGRHRRAAEPGGGRALAGARGRPGLCRGAGAARHAVHPRSDPADAGRIRRLVRASCSPRPMRPRRISRPVLRWARKAAEGGSADGQAVLGYILTSGPETMRDLDEAHHWYERSAAAGCPQGALGFALSLARTATTQEQQGLVAEQSASCRGCRPADGALSARR